MAETRTKDFTIVEKYQQGKEQAIAIRPYFNQEVENMGLEKYGMTLHDGVYHMEELSCLEINGIKRYVTGLNEFAPEVKSLPEKERQAKIKEIRKTVTELEAQLAANVLKVDDPEFWNKVKILRPDNHDFWSRISIKCGNDPLYLDPKKDPYDLIKLYAIKAGGFSIVAHSLSDAKVKRNCRFYLDQVKATSETRTSLSKIRNKALSNLQKLYDENASKLFYVTKVTDPNSSQYTKSTPIDILYENMDNYINGKGTETSKRKAALEFTNNATDSMEALKLRALVKDGSFYQIIASKSNGWIVETGTNIKLGKSVEEVLEFLKNPINEETYSTILEKVDKYWNS